MQNLKTVSKITVGKKSISVNYDPEPLYICMVLRCQIIALTSNLSSNLSFALNFTSFELNLIEIIVSIDCAIR